MNRKRNTKTNDGYGGRSMKIKEDSRKVEEGSGKIPEKSRKDWWFRGLGEAVNQHFHGTEKDLNARIRRQYHGSCPVIYGENPMNPLDSPTNCVQQ